MVNYRCENCNYGFNSEGNEKVKKCLYCGKETAVPEKSAEELIGE